MKRFEWNEEKNQTLRLERNISFEEVVIAIESNRLLIILEHPNKNKYPNQRIYIININDYAFLIPFVEDEEKVFLKTIIPSHQATKKYIINQKTKNK